MDIRELRRSWDELGRTDPLWSILTAPDKKGGRWGANEFFESGLEEINAVMRYIESLGIDVARRRALDFGCGVGRLTQAIANHFEEVCGVDIAPSMIEQASKFNLHGDKCKYFVNETDDLNLFADNGFDFIYSNLVLQHMSPRYSKRYISEFLRILAPRGLLIFQQPSREKPSSKGSGICRNVRELTRSIVPSLWIELYRNKVQARNGEQPRIEMYEIKRPEIVRLLKENGAQILDIQEESWHSNWISLRYCVTKH